MVVRAGALAGEPGQQPPERARSSCRDGEPPAHRRAAHRAVARPDVPVEIRRDVLAPLLADIALLPAAAASGTARPAARRTDRWTRALQPWSHPSVAGPGQWVLLSHRLPHDPSGPRTTAWRRLRRLGVAQFADAPEAAGLDVLLRGLSMTGTDERTLAVSAALFDGLHEHLRRRLLLGREPA